MKLSQISEARYAGSQDKLKIIAEQLESGMAGTGILDDADEVIAEIQRHHGDDQAGAVHQAGLIHRGRAPVHHQAVRRQRAGSARQGGLD